MRGALLALAVGLFLMSCTAVYGPAAMPSESPGAPSATPSTGAQSADACHVNGTTFCVLNPDVMQSTIAQTICVSGWTRTIRPPVSYTDQLKREQLAAEAAQHPTWTMRTTEEDHRLPLELGGAPSDPHNLSPEFPRSPNPKDDDESRLRSEVCSGRMSLEDAQRTMVQTWLRPWPDYTH